MRGLAFLKYETADRQTEEIRSCGAKAQTTVGVRQHGCIHTHRSQIYPALKAGDIYYLEHCRVLVKGGPVEFVTDEGKRSLYWNIPIANTTTVMLGTGTSITQAAMRYLAKAGVLVGFCGGAGTPLFTANEVDIEVAWFPRKANIDPLNTCRRGSSSGSMMTFALLRSRPFSTTSLCVFVSNGSTARCAMLASTSTGNGWMSYCSAPASRSTLPRKTPTC
jgi:hypothetical protein